MKTTTCLAAGLAALGFASAAFAAPADPLALYQFEAGNASDTSGNGNDGTVVDGVTFLGAGSGFDGVGRAADFSPVLGLSGIDTGIDINSIVYPEITFGAWVFADGPGIGVGGKVLSHDNGGFDRTLGIDSRGTSPGSDYAAFSGSGVLDTPGGITGWVHVAASYDGTTTSLYRNGALAGTASDTTDLGTSLFDLFIGTNPGFNEDFEGRIDEVFVYARLLSEADIRSIFDDGFDREVVPVPGALVLFAPFAVAALRQARGRRPA